MGIFSSTRDWGRLLTAMITPFNNSGEIDFTAARRIARFLVEDQQNDGIVVNGTTGESPTTTSEEKLKLLETVLEEVGDRAAVVAGCGSYDTRESVLNTQEATKLGVHGIMIVNPYYNKPGQRGLVAHYQACARATELPVLVYNIEPRSAINLVTASLMELIKEPNIVAVKEASGNLGQISDVISSAPKGFRVYSGDDALTLPILSLGGYGVVSVAGHVVGSEIKRMIEIFQSNPAEASMIHHQIMPTVKACFCAPNPVPVKQMLSKRGLCDGSVRLPLVPLSDEELTIVDQV